ncbi:LLM class flavin-dependent oxidoreductase [Acrocarpospora sp. B8E8]|uniref:LLM class flavin-dependent oxidoreductase n=1 Tax=Acrocarpospora sp. B8E8 TaxID=3153572 RepID=UPI00325FAA09
MTRSGEERPLRRGLVFATAELDPLGDLARQAEAAGFQRVWTTEYPHRDAVVRALAVALRTETIEIGTGIAYAFARVPLAMAAMAADVQRLSGGRFSLGLSPGTRGVRRWFGADFEPPAPALVAYAAALRAAWSQNEDLAGPPPPVLGAALNPVMGRHVAAHLDGVLLHPLAIARRHLVERLLPAVAEGSSARAGRPPKVIAWCVTSIDHDEEVARARARAQLAFYFSTPSYRTVAAGTGWEHIPAEVQRGFKAVGGSWARLGELIPDSVVDELTVSGTPATAARRVRRLERELGDLGVTEIAFQTVGAEVGGAAFVASCQQIIHSLAPGATGEPDV